MWSPTCVTVKITPKSIKCQRAFISERLAAPSGTRTSLPQRSSASILQSRKNRAVHPMGKAHRWIWWSADHPGSFGTDGLLCTKHPAMVQSEDPCGLQNPWHIDDSTACGRWVYVRRPCNSYRPKILNAPWSAPHLCAGMPRGCNDHYILNRQDCSTTFCETVLFA